MKDKECCLCKSGLSRIDLSILLESMIMTTMHTEHITNSQRWTNLSRVSKSHSPTRDWLNLMFYAHILVTISFIGALLQKLTVNWLTCLPLSKNSLIQVLRRIQMMRLNTQLLNLLTLTEQTHNINIQIAHKEIIWMEKQLLSNNLSLSTQILQQHIFKMTFHRSSKRKFKE